MLLVNINPGTSLSHGENPNSHPLFSLLPVRINLQLPKQKCVVKFELYKGKIRIHNPSNCRCEFIFMTSDRHIVT